MTRTRIGDTVRRKEDPRLLTGRGCYVDDISPPGLARMVVVRSPVAHADIRLIDITAAAAAPGVLAVLTGADYAADGLGDIPCHSLPKNIVGEDWFQTPYPALISDRVRCVGDAVAVVVAETLATAQDAAELVAVDYAPLPAVVLVADALRPGAPVLWPEAAENICFETAYGNADKTAVAFAAATHVVALRIVNGRLAVSPMEPRGAIGEYDPEQERYTLTTSTQNPHGARDLLAKSIFRVSADRVRVKAGDVGGGFGLKVHPAPEDILVPWAARRVGRPVKWIADRGESMLTDFAGRDQVAEGRMALDGNERILGLEVIIDQNLGCRLSHGAGVSALLCGRLITGVYDVPAAHVRIRGVFTNTRSTAPYRGAGRPEAAFFVERLIDKAARECGLDAVAIRRRNFIRPDQMPYRTALLDTFDCGTFEAVMDDALDRADWDGFAARRAESAERGLLRGRGLSCYMEVAALYRDRMEIRIDPSGRATVIAGTFSHGQGHETVYPQMVSDWLGLPLDGIDFAQGDTDQAPSGGGTFGSRSMTVGGSALRMAADGIIKKGRDLAAQVLDAAGEEIDFDDSLFTVRGTNRSLSLAEAAKAPGADLQAVGYFITTRQNYPNGCHVAEVEIDPELGRVQLDRYLAVDDIGTVINPLLADGQIQGGIAQGAGQALIERVVYDDDGQLLTGSFADYAMPRADDLPPIRTAFHAVPTDTNPLGVTGVGETGAVGAPPAIVQAITDALAPLGVHDIEMPATPSRIWQAIRDAREGA